MTIRVGFALLLLLLALPFAALGQSADQEVVSVADSPDPVVPGQNITYTVTLRNNGPNPATNGGVNVNLGPNLAYQSSVAPAGYTCATFGAAVSCSTPSFASGTTVTITIVAQLAAHLVNFPDGSVASNFAPSGTTADPVPANNSKSATTSYNSPQIDLGLSVSDSPDPVGPDANITYTVPLRNEGPDSATSVNFNVFNNGTLRFQSATAPPGFACTLPAVGGVPQFTCTAATFAPGATPTFTVVLRADDDVLGINDAAVQVNFNINGTGDDTDDPDNSETESTGYVTPDADLSVSVTDSPDPVAPDQNVTYTVVLTHAGPDPATNAILNVYNNGTLRHQSTTAPAGFSCSAPAASGPQSYSCSSPSLAVGSYNFTIVMRAEDEVLGNNDGSFSTSFSVGSALSDPNNGNNVETETTGYVAPDANLSVSVVDAPDPVSMPNAFDYLVTFANAGPDTATNLRLDIFNNGTLRYVSVDVPAAFTCFPPAVGAAPVFGCTAASLASGASVQFVLRARPNENQIPPNGRVVTTSFNASSAIADPSLANNLEIEETTVRTDLLFSDGFE